MAQTALNGPGERIDALRDTMAELLEMQETRIQFAAMMCGLDIRYNLGEGHPLLGRRMPDLDLRTSTGLVRLFTLLHPARGILLKFGDRTWDFDLAPWEHRVSMAIAQSSCAWDLPAVGTVAAPDAALIRPDGHVAWVGDGTAEGLHEALDRWFT
ncbi:hypothetical protein DQP56_07790 [Mycolicibacter senuensis]|nr:hypothetical protein DQP56_07790 [Mycolicibacter senuensis]